MLPYTKATVSQGDDYRLGCIEKCIKPHKMEISASLNMSATYIEEHAPDSRGTRA